ncbi:hypothetical protein GCM10025865_27860 [Paraoerskovia sediminicola]|uniref:AbiEi antitoxin C-terminal domain-containing protein n=1 Tax=Paraoerskovia sediminicola TaxID=1138587 RepID=A0ABM8G5T7_9CELL|nr:hypothetical protein GCM10025865_27860 [Paraoerskovia sediminicola]
MGPDPGPIVHSSQVGGAVAFQTLVRDGVLRHLLDDVGVRAGADVDPGMRAEAALTRTRLPSATIGGLGAAWIHAGGPVPDELDVLVPPGHGAPAPRPGCSPRYVRLTQDERVVIDGVPVTSVLRTALDVATAPARGSRDGDGDGDGGGGDRARTRDRERATDALDRLVRVCGLDLDHVVHALELKQRWRGRTQAVALVHEARRSGHRAAPAAVA